MLGFNLWRIAYEVDCRFKQFGGLSLDFSNELNSDCYAVESPDSFYAADSKTGCTFMRYTENNLVAGTACAFPAYRTTVIGFPFETIRKADKRDALMKQVIDFFEAK